MKERYFLEQIIVPNAVFVVTIADRSFLYQPPQSLSELDLMHAGFAA